VMFDAGISSTAYKEPDYAMAACREERRARDGWCIGHQSGTLPHEIERIVGEVAGTIPAIARHPYHNGHENGRRQHLAAVQLRRRQVQGTDHGLASAAAMPNMIAHSKSVLKMVRHGMKDGALQRLRICRACSTNR